MKLNMLFKEREKNIFYLALITQFLGLLVLLGWVLNITVLKSIAPGFISMNPLTAVNFILIGTLIILLNHYKLKAYRALTLLLPIIILIPIILKILDLVLSTSFNPDLILFKNSLGTNKMSEATILSFMIMSVAFLLLNFENISIRISQSMALGCLCLSLIYMCGYIYDFNSLISSSVFIPMAIHTSFLFILISFAFLFLNPEKGFMSPIMSKGLGGHISRKILPLLILIPFIVGYFRLLGQRGGLYTTDFGTAIFVVTVSLLSGILIWYYSKILNQIDHSRKLIEDQWIKNSHALEKSKFLLSETGKMNKIGGWEMYLSDNAVIWSDEIYYIYGLELHQEISLETVISSYLPDDQILLTEGYTNAIKNGISYDLKLKLNQAHNKEIWVRAKGQAIFDNKSKIIGIRGTLQDIDEEKRKEALLKISMNLIEEQNKRLLSFSHIVSHNLRSHSGNLKMTLDLLDIEESEDDKIILQGNIRKTSDALNLTISHLNEVVRVQTDLDQSKSDISFEEIMSLTLSILQPEITESKSTIVSNFKEIKTINYIPAYLESIFLNFTTNAIKYRQPNLPAVLHITSLLKNNRTVLIFSDNGMGIDLEKHGHKVFGMYKTFHSNANAKGIGLFLTKTQVESLGGTIKIQSEVNKGTTFTITF